MSTIEELKTSIADIDGQIQTLETKRTELLKQLKAAEHEQAQVVMKRILGEIKSLNIDPSDLAKALGLSTQRSLPLRAPTKTGEPKYRSSIDPNLTWTGKGRKPGWIQTFLDNGGNLEDWKI